MLKDNVTAFDCNGQIATVKTYPFKEMANVGLLLSNQKGDKFVSPKNIFNESLKTFVENKKRSGYVKGGVYRSKTTNNITLGLDLEKEGKLNFQPSRALSSELENKELPQLLDTTELFYGAYVDLKDLKDGLITPLECNTDTSEWQPSSKGLKITPRAALIGDLDTAQTSQYVTL